MPSERYKTSEKPGRRLWVMTIGTYLLLTFTAAGVRFGVTERWSPLVIGLTSACGLAACATWLAHFNELATAPRKTIIRIALTIALFAVIHAVNCLEDAGSLLGFWGKDHGGIMWSDAYLHGALGATYLAWFVATYQTGKARQ